MNNKPMWHYDKRVQKGDAHKKKSLKGINTTFKVTKQSSKNMIVVENLIATLSTMLFCHE